jgi:hypothetical protein
MDMNKRKKKAAKDKDNERKNNETSKDSDTDKNSVASKNSDTGKDSDTRLVLNDSSSIKVHMTQNFLPNFYASPESAMKMMTNNLFKLTSFPSYRTFVFSCYDVTSCS